MIINNIIKRIEFLDIYDLQKYQFCKNPKHAQLYRIQEYTLDFLYYYKREKCMNNTQWIRDEIKLLEKFLKYLKIQIKISNSLYDAKTILDSETL